MSTPTQEGKIGADQAAIFNVQLFESELNLAQKLFQMTLNHLTLEVDASQ